MAQVFASNTISSPPSSIDIKLPEPKSKEEAIKRISDYIILNLILPPVISRNKLKDKIYGNYKNYVEDIIKKKKDKSSGNDSSCTKRNARWGFFFKKKLKQDLNARLDLYLNSPHGDNSIFKFIFRFWKLATILLALIISVLLFCYIHKKKRETGKRNLKKKQNPSICGGIFLKLFIFGDKLLIYRK